MASAHIYCRVSSAGQEDGYSLDTQEAACRRYCAEHGLLVASVAREVWSGADRERPELTALLERLAAGDAVLAYALDRVSRSQIDTAILVDRIEKAGARLVLVTEDFERSATGTFLRNARAFAAELEHEKIRERTQRGRRERVAQGKPIAGASAPYGYRWNADKSAFLLDDATAPVVRLIFDLAIAGKSLRAVGRELEAKGIPTPSGKPHWSPMGLRHILTRPIYAGTHVAYRHRHVRQANGKYTERPAREDERVLLPGIAPAIVSEAQFAAVQERLATNKQHSTRNNKHPEATLLRAGVIRCGYCGWGLSVKHAPPSQPGRSPLYLCTNAQCHKPSIAASIIDGPIWADVARVLRNPEIIAAEVAKKREGGGLARDLAAVEASLASIASKQERTAKHIMAIDDADVAAPLIAELQSLATMRKKAERERDALAQRIADAAIDQARVRTFTDSLRTVAKNVQRLTYAERRWALDALGVEVRLHLPRATDETGQPLDRWVMTMDPGAVVSPSTRLAGHKDALVRLTFTSGEREPVSLAAD